MASPGYLQYPHINGDLVVFVAADDVWLAPVTGGRAWRFTADQARVSTPRFAADGGHVAWASSRDGGTDIYLGERGRRDEHPALVLGRDVGACLRLDRRRGGAGREHRRPAVRALHVGSGARHADLRWRRHRPRAAVRPGGGPVRRRRRRRAAERHLGQLRQRSRVLEALPRRNRRATVGRPGG